MVDRTQLVDQELSYVVPNSDVRREASIKQM